MNKIIAVLSRPFVLRYKRWNRRLTLSKRQQFVVITLLLVTGLVATQLVTPDYRFGMVGALSVCAYMLTAFGLREDLSGVEWFTLLALPVLFTSAVSLFYFLLPTRWLTRIPIALLYGVGMYALLLTENIFNVAVNRTIALLRPAHSIGFLLTLITFFFLTQTALSLRTYPWINSLTVGVVAWMLSLQSLWSITLEEKIGDTVAHFAITVSIILAQTVWIISLWPVNTTIRALFLTTVFYSVNGISQQYLQEKLYKKTILEFLSVTIFVFIILLFASNWYSE